MIAVLAWLALAEPTCTRVDGTPGRCVSGELLRAAAVCGAELSACRDEARLVVPLRAALTEEQATRIRLEVELDRARRSRWSWLAAGTVVGIGASIAVAVAVP